VWNSAWQGSGYFSIAQIDLTRGDYQKAIEHIDHSLDRNARNGKAYVVKIAALRKLEDYAEALNNCAIALKKDQFNLGVYFEQYKIYQALHNDAPAKNAISKLKELARSYVHNYIEYALDYAAAGLIEEAIELLEHATGDNETVYPMLSYYLGWLYYQLKKEEEGKRYFAKAAKAGADYCFPNRLEDIAVLQLALEKNPSDAKAPYYLGNLWYDKRQYKEAIEHWELSAKRDDRFSTVFRNLGIAYFNKQNDAQKALIAYEKSFSLNPFDARVLMELDQLYKRLNKEPKERLEFLEKHLEVVEQRDDLYLERSALYNFLGDHEKAYQLILERKFHPWEGGEGKVSGQYVYSLVEMAKQFIHSGDFKKAIDLLGKAQTYPHNLGEGKLYGAQENDIFYWMACAYEESGDASRAKEFFEKATKGLSEPTAAMFYNDQQPDKIFYQGLAWNKLGEKEKSTEIFSKLVEYGLSHLNDDVKIDYFAVSLPDLLIFEDDLNVRNKIHCHYMMGLGYLGLLKTEKAKAELKQALQQDVMHFGCKTHLKFIQQLKEHTVATRVD
jgi:tetratricopeptide (TPR) repeat protein